MKKIEKLTSLLIVISLFFIFSGCENDSPTEEDAQIGVVIISPKDGEKVEQRVITVKGIVDNTDLIQAVLSLNDNDKAVPAINNSQVIPVIDGKFSQEVALMAGENRIEVSVEGGGFTLINVTADVPAADLAAVLLWEGAKGTDVDLYVVAPDNEEASLLYEDTLTTKIGGQMTTGAVNGRKYESFILPSGKAIKGNYLIKVNYYSDGKAIGQPINASVTVSINENTPQRMMKHFGLHTIKAHGLVDPEAWWVVTLVFLPDGLFSTDESM